MNCESKKYRRIVVKIGSNVLTREDGRPDTTRISALVDQLARLHRAGTEFILVSSGAVASGRSLLETRVGRIDTVSARQLFSAVGQVKLLNRYYDLFNEYGIACGQVLTTKESLSTRRQYLNQRNCMEAMLAAGPEAGRGAASKRVHTTSRSVRIRSVRILSRRPLAITTSMPSPAARDEMRLLVVMPPRPREERAVSMYCERSRPGATRRMTCEAGSEGEPS